MSDSPQSNDTDNSKISSNDIVNNSNTSSSPTPSLFPFYLLLCFWNRKKKKKKSHHIISDPTPSVVGKVKSRLSNNSFNGKKLIFKRYFHLD